jgi:3-hydroxyacyl-CoA dehydrogenase/enoyl-CoA hydratase/3-hydroxybutyryl-CoA epimerase/enoyl-CoA isomerase
VQIFLANQQIKKKSLQHAGRGKAIKRVAVLGAGIMGGGIAYSSAVKGMPVLLKDIAQGALDLGIGEARKLLGKQIESGRMKQGQADAILSSITPLLEFEQFDQVEMAVEAVVESLAVKQQVISQVESLVRPGTVIVSNTSSLAIADIAAPLQRPQDVAGMHFFNPVHLMPLVEVVRGPRTSEETVAGVVAYALAMGKTPLVVKDCPGFLINRILGAYFTAFLLLIRDGAGFEQVDRAMEAWGWPMGPAYLLDVAGLDTLDKALLILGKAYPEVMATPFKTAINILAAEKRYGQKTGAGFYRYERTPGGKPRRSADPAAYDLLRQGQPQGTRTFEDQDIVNRMMLAMILEADRCLHEAVAEGPLEIDAGMRMGTGFPAHAGGPLWHADQIGLEVVAARAQALRPLGGLYQPSPGLLSRVGQKLSYYGAQGELTPAAV